MLPVSSRRRQIGSRRSLWTSHLFFPASQRSPAMRSSSFGTTPSRHAGVSRSSTLIRTSRCGERGRARPQRKVRPLPTWKREGGAGGARRPTRSLPEFSKKTRSGGQKALRFTVSVESYLPSSRASGAALSVRHAEGRVARFRKRIATRCRPCAPGARGLPGSRSAPFSPSGVPLWAPASVP